MLFLSVSVLLLTFASCKQNKSENAASNAHENDSLEQILSQKDSEINDMMALMNEVQEGFRQRKMVRELTRNKCCVTM